jgi:hypothetical protein
MDLGSSLRVAHMFADFRSYRQIYLAFSEPGMKAIKGIEDRELIVGLVKQDGFNFLGGESFDEDPANEVEQLTLITALDSIIWSTTIREDVNNPLSKI